MGNKLPLNFILSFCREIVPGKGEDSFCHSFCDSAGLLGAFDGCGGAGARKHGAYGDHTEAYMASRFCAGVFFDSFCEAFPGNVNVPEFAKQVAARVRQRLQDYEPPKDSEAPLIRGSMIRTLPTTAAAALVQARPDGLLQVSALWAGDSRVYILDAAGLHQMTQDDTSVPDPMENLYEDGILRNIFCSDRPVKLHCKTVTVQPPFLAFAATDGCFGYVSSPMEFEGMLLESMLSSESAAQWEERLAQTIASVAGDDHTLVLGAFGYRDFTELRNIFAARYGLLRQNWLDAVRALPLEDRTSRYGLWDSYRPDYSIYLKDGQG